MVEAVIVDSLAMPHGFFTRRGGVSSGPYASLNCSLSSQDQPAAILENRARAACAIGGDPAALMGLRQVHGVHVVTVMQPWAIGQGPAADAMVTSQPGLALGIVTADCAPVLFADAAANVVGAAHAGWRGAVLGVLEATLDAMTALGACPSRIIAAVGPCIAQTSYEVGADLRDAVLARGSADACFFLSGRRADRWQFDLAGYCASRLAAAGVGQIVQTGLDTLADAEGFFSHRRRTLAQAATAQGSAGISVPIGHQISAIRPA